MTDIEKAMIMLQVIDAKAPTNINWSNEEMWLNALVKGFEAIAEEERDWMNCKQI